MNVARLVSNSFLQQKKNVSESCGWAGSPPNKLKIMFEFIELLIAYVAVAKSGLSDRAVNKHSDAIERKNYSAAMKRRTS